MNYPWQNYVLAFLSVGCLLFFAVAVIFGPLISALVRDWLDRKDKP